MPTSRVLKRYTDQLLELCTSERQRIRIAEHILSRARGENDGDAETNGEYRLLETVKRHFSRPDGVFFDVGAHHGEWTRRAALDAPAGGRIYAFEPCADSFAVLQRSTSAQPSSLRLFNLALSDRDSEGVLYRVGTGAGTSSLHCRDHGPSGVKSSGVEEVRTRRGDGFCEEEGIGHITFVKIDAEGHDFAVMRGFERMLSAGKIDCLQFEYGGAWIDSRTFLADARDWLTSRGYQVSRLYPNGIRLNEVYEAADENFRLANYVAARNDVMQTLTEP